MRRRFKHERNPNLGTAILVMGVIPRHLGESLAADKKYPPDRSRSSFHSSRGQQMWSSALLWKNYPNLGPAFQLGSTNLVRRVFGATFVASAKPDEIYAFGVSHPLFASYLDSEKA